MTLGGLLCMWHYLLNSEPFEVVLESLYFAFANVALNWKSWGQGNSTWWHYINFFCAEAPPTINGLQMRQNIQRILLAVVVICSLDFTLHLPSAAVKSCIYVANVANLLAYADLILGSYIPWSRKYLENLFHHEWVWHYQIKTVWVWG